MKTKAEGDAWIRDYMANLDHKIRLDKIRKEGEDYRKKFTEFRRKDEDFSKWCIESRLQTAQFMNMVKGSPMPLDVAERAHEMRIEQAAIVLPADQPFVQMWREDLESDARTLKVTIIWEQHLAGLQAYAWPTLKRCEIAIPTTAGLYATGKHEIGHNANPCQPSHTRVVTNEKLKQSCCPECEVAAWRWAIAHAKPTWTQRMHDRLSRSLATYRKHAKDGSAVAAEMDHLCSPMAYFEARQARAAGRTL